MGAVVQYGERRDDQPRRVADDEARVEEPDVSGVQVAVRHAVAVEDPQLLKEVDEVFCADPVLFPCSLAFLEVLLQQCGLAGLAVLAVLLSFRLGLGLVSSALSRSRFLS
jgi:hypothetical protein